MTQLEETKLTPMMRQWYEAKNLHQDAILLFRMGDFYELFGQDALIAAPLLDLTLTSRDKDKSGLKMAGFPFHAAENYIAKLIEHGHKVAICEQLEDPKNKVGVVKRGITNVITPGTAIDCDSDVKGDLAYLVSIVYDEQGWALCALDYATAKFLVTRSRDKQSIIDEVIRLCPRELIVNKDDQNAQLLIGELKNQLKKVRVEQRASLKFKAHAAPLHDLLLNEYEQNAVLLVLSYVLELKGAIPPHITVPTRYSIENQLLMDEATRSNLDLIPKNRSDAWNLFSVLDDCRTVMGRRALLQTIKSPSTSMDEITDHHNKVQELVDDPVVRHKVRDCLARFYDLDKLIASLSSFKISPRAMGNLRECLLAIEHLGLLLNESQAVLLRGLVSALPDITSLKERLSQDLVDEPPLLIKDARIFKQGVYLDLDEQVDLMKNGHALLLDLEAQERTKTQIPSLKIKYTRVFGYYIEVTKSHLDKVPPSYVRKQTIAQGERYTTEALSVLESKIAQAEIKAFSLEEKYFNDLCACARGFIAELIACSKVIALCDMLANFAEQAERYRLVKPQMLEAQASVTDIKQGRHLIVESLCQKDGSYFVPNDVLLNDKTCSLMLITGPNMAGKSTIMRQVALIQILAQMGSFVPAASATLSVCDKIFARVGASDDASTKRSTFMVEMTETAAILHNATSHSLILLDEIGRGTSTYDGLSIAQAVAEYIHDQVKARTLFATHYHELTKLEQPLKLLKNFHVQIDESSSGISFLYTLIYGPCLKSFGIEVARISGLPQSVLNRAQEVLESMEETIPAVAAATDHVLKPHVQPDLFGKMSRSSFIPSIKEQILSMDTNRMTPLQALNKLASIQQILRKSVS